MTIMGLAETAGYELYPSGVARDEFSSEGEFIEAGEDSIPRGTRDGMTDADWENLRGCLSVVWGNYQL